MYFLDELYEHLLEVNVRFKGDNKRVINIRNGYKDGRNGQKISHFYEPSLKYNNSNKYGKDGLPIAIHENFNGKLEIQGEAAKHYSVSDIDDTGKKIIKTILKEEEKFLLEYWFLDPDQSRENYNRFEELKNYFITKYSSKRF